MQNRSEITKLCVEKIENVQARTQHYFVMKAIIEIKLKDPIQVTPFPVNQLCDTEKLAPIILKDFLQLVQSQFPIEEKKYTQERAVKIRMHVLLILCLSGLTNTTHMEVLRGLLNIILSKPDHVNLMNSFSDLMFNYPILQPQNAGVFFEGLSSESMQLRIPDKQIGPAIIKIIDKLARLCIHDFNRFVPADQTLIDLVRSAKQEVMHNLWEFVLRRRIKDKEAKDMLNRLILENELGQGEMVLVVRGTQHMKDSWSRLKTLSDECLRKINNEKDSIVKGTMLGNLAHIWIYAFNTTRGPETIGRINNTGKEKLSLRLVWLI